MRERKIGIITECFRVELVDAISRAARLGADAVQISVGRRGDATDLWTPDYRKRVRSALNDHGLAVSALVGELGGHGLAAPEENEWKIPEIIRMMPIAREFGCDIITTHVGVIPSDGAHNRFAVIRDALIQLALAGKREGCRIAIETGPEPPETLLSMLHTVGSEYIGVNYDPANLRMVCGVDPVAGVETLKDVILHVHVKDGRMINYVGPEVVYGFFAEGGIGDLRLEECFLETPLGEGQVDLPGWFDALDKIGYHGYYTIEREVGDNPEADIAKAVTFIRSLS